MFTDFEYIRGSLLTERVNTLLGSVFLGTCALWAALFIWNVTSGSNPLDKAIAKIVVENTLSY